MTGTIPKGYQTDMISKKKTSVLKRQKELSDRGFFCRIIEYEGKLTGDKMYKTVVKMAKPGIRAKRKK